MTEWIEGSFEETLSTLGTVSAARELYNNDDEARVERTIVDGWVTIIVSNSSLMQVRFWGPCPNLVVAGDFSFAAPRRDERMAWYWFNCAAGPLVFRTRSKRTFYHSDELWVQCALLTPSVSSVVRVGWQFLLSP